jgi:hypothetical protein
MDTTYLIENAAQEFWARAGEAPGFPRNMNAAITLALPLELCCIEELRVNHVRAWLKRVRMAHRISGKDRRLHGCLIAYKGKGAIFFDRLDSEAEQRFTLAHELAHFLLDYQATRQRTLEILGPSILAVLDGERPPTLDERLHAALSTVSLGVMSHFMERPDKGLPSTAILDVENRADRLALELLAPAASLYDVMASSAAPRGFKRRLAFLQQQLIEVYGLPPLQADIYADLILKQLGEPTFRDWLYGEA